MKPTLHIYKASVSGNQPDPITRTKFLSSPAMIVFENFVKLLQATTVAWESCCVVQKVLLGFHLARPQRPLFLRRHTDKLVFTT